MGRLRHLLAAIAATGTLALASGASISYYEQALPSTMNPLFARTMVDRRTHELVFDRLFFRSPVTNEISSRLVASWEAKEGGRQLEMTLVPGIRWHDGKALTPEDICFTIDAMLNPGTPSPNAKPFRESIEGCEADNRNNVVRVSFQRAYHNPELRLSFAVLPKHAFASTAIAPDDEFSSRPTGTGPMRGSLGRTAVKLTAQANAHQNPRIAEMSLTEGTDSLVQVRTVLNGGVQGIISVAPQMRPDVAASDDVALKSYDLRSWWFVAVNTARGPLRDKKVRQALDLTLDRTDLRQLTIGVEPDDRNPPCEFVSGPFVQSSPYYNHRVPTHEVPDMERAAALMREAGAVMQAGRWTIKGAPVVFKIGMHAPLEKEAPDLLNQIGNQLTSGGFDRQIYKIGDEDWLRTVVTGNTESYDLLIGKWSFGVVEDVMPMFHTRAANRGEFNIFNYSNPEVDRLLEAHENARTDTEAQDAYHSLHELLSTELPYLFLWKLDTKSAWRNEIRNNHIAPYYYFTVFDGWKAVE